MLSKSLYVTLYLSVTGDAYNFANNLAQYLNGKRTSFPTAIVNRFFNSIKYVGDKFISAAASFNSTYLNTSNSDLPCLTNQWNQKQIALAFTVGFALKVFPPKEFVVGAGFNCATLDCWGCVADNIIGVISKRSTPVPKRSVAAQTTRATSSVSVVSGVYSVNGLSNCTEYLCSGGTWDSNICVCLCKATTDLWTPQYGCFNAVEYQNGQAPPGANPKANPNNANYDPTVDPYSSQYKPSKDPNPYYNPYATTKKSDSIRFLFSMALLILVLVI